jgi:hypothetical protein
MPRPKPRVATRHEVNITRTGETAIIEFHDGVTPTTNLTIGKDVSSMTDAEILDCYNQCVRVQQEMAASYAHVAVEIPEGQPQIEYHKTSESWTPRGDVLRCEVGDNECFEPVVTIDGQDFSWEEFGRMVVSYAGWGMRVIFVPDNELSKSPIIEVREPDN